jgi:uncharacterized protein (TIGR02594 family)
VSEPFWLSNARRYLGTAETPGKDTTPIIDRWLMTLGAWWRDDETPWCGVFVAAVMRESGIGLPKHWYRALAWRGWGERLLWPELGSVAVLGRKGGGHVGFVLGEDTQNRIVILGGNQGNRVSVLPFDRGRLLECRWPIGYPRIHTLPVLASSGAASTNEA